MQSGNSIIADLRDFENLFDQFYRPLYLFTTWLLNGSNQEPEDVALDVFYLAWQKRKEFSDMQKIKTFLFNEAASQCKKLRQPET